MSEDFLLLHRSKSQPETLPQFHWQVDYKRNTPAVWSLAACGADDNLMWLKSGDSVLEIATLLQRDVLGNRDFWLSLAKYTTPKFETEYIASIDRNYIYIPRSEKVPYSNDGNSDANHKAIEFILSLCEDDDPLFDIPAPTSVACDTNGYCLSWNYKKSIGLKSIEKWRYVQDRLWMKFACICEPKSEEACMNPNIMLPLGRVKDFYSIAYAFDADRDKKSYPFFSLA